MFLNRPLQTAAILAVTIFTTPSVEAQYQSTYGVQYTSRGNQHHGGTAYSYGRVSLYKNGSYASAAAELYMSSTAKLFQQTRNAVTVSAVATSSGQPGTAWSLGSFKVDVGGQRILSRNFIRGENEVVDEPLIVHSNKLFQHDVYMSIPTGPVSVLVAGNAMSLLWVWDCRIDLDSDVEVGIDGRIKVGSYCYVSSIDGPAGVEMGVQGQSWNPNHSVNFDAEAEADDGLDGSMICTVGSIYIKLNAYVKMWGKTWRTVLTDEVAPFAQRLLFDI